MLHVAQISFFLDPQGREPQQLLQDWPSLSDAAEAACSAGVRVSVVQACSRHQQLTQNGVDYHFVAPDQWAPSVAVGRAFSALVQRLGADVFHVHGLGFPADVLALAKLAPGVPIIVQDHASGLPRIWRRPLWRHALSTVSAVAFCAAAQAQPFIRSQLLPAHTPVFEIPESTSRFGPADQAQARLATGLHGDPCLLWVGHLNDNKDPLTVLAGVSEAARHLPELQLWCCFGTAPLLRQAEERINADPMLRGRVHLLGRVPHERIAELMRAADVFVLGSHREGSGYSVIEALACGLPPVVTDIPSFRVLTGQGTIGQLWQPGDAQQLSSALRWIASQPRAELRASTRRHFDEELSFAAVGRKLRNAYRAVLERTASQLGSAL